MAVDGGVADVRAGRALIRALGVGVTSFGAAPAASAGLAASAGFATGAGLAAGSGLAAGAGFTVFVGFAVGSPGDGAWEAALAAFRRAETLSRDGAEDGAPGPCSTVPGAATTRVEVALRAPPVFALGCAVVPGDVLPDPSGARSLARELAIAPELVALSCAGAGFASLFARGLPFAPRSVRSAMCSPCCRYARAGSSNRASRRRSAPPKSSTASRTE